MNDFLIVGGGLIGLLTARALSETGAKITVLERNHFGQESSWAGGGILSPLYPWKYPQAVNTLASWSQPRYQELATKLEQSTGIDVEWINSGLLILDVDQADDAMAWKKQTNANVSLVTTHEIRTIEPAIGPDNQGAIWLPEVAQVRNPKFLKALLEDLKQRGVRMAENSEVSHILTKRGHVEGVRTEYSEIMAKNVIVACGAWSAKLLKALNHEIPIIPVRGQMILFNARPGQLKRIVLKDGYYAIPRRDGRVLVGSTMEDVGFDKNITEEARGELEETARHLVPFLADAEVEKHWSGLRPGSPSGIPFIGPHPGVKGLYINAGHFRNGVVMAPASAQLMSDILLGHKTIVDPAPFSLERRLSAA